MYVHLSVSVSVQSARRELEHQRQSEWECQRREQLVAERLREQGTVDSLSAELGQLRHELDVLVSLCWIFVSSLLGCIACLLCTDAAAVAVAPRTAVDKLLHMHTPRTHARTRARTRPFNGPFSGATQVSRYQKGKTNLDFTEARDSEWQWHQLGHMQVCTSLQTDNYAITPSLRFFTGRIPFLLPN